uniref:Uncharacterized protein n=1 Tax=Romanomermis culicivorax TaxID=13658 RepID=A0A915J951_ROMCU
MHKTENGTGADCATKKDRIDENRVNSIVNASGDSGVLSASSSPGLTNGHSKITAAKDSTSLRSDNDDDGNNAKNEEIVENGDNLKNLTLTDELILIQDNSFNIKVAAPGCEMVDLQVSFGNLKNKI